MISHKINFTNNNTETLWYLLPEKDDLIIKFYKVVIAHSHVLTTCMAVSVMGGQTIEIIYYFVYWEGKNKYKLKIFHLTIKRFINGN